MGNKTIIALLGLALVSTCLGQEGALCHTNIITPRHFFTVEEFVGTWHLYADGYGLAENVPELNFKCYNITILPTSNPLVLAVEERFIDITDGQETPVVLESTATVENTALPAIWTYHVPSGNETVSKDAVVLHAEYEDWAIQYGCTRINDYRNEQIAMLIKNPTIDDRAARMLRTMAVGYGFPMDNQRIIDQSC